MRCAVEVTFEPGTCAPAQGNNNPPALFVNHALAVVNGVYYDPSYGQSYSSLVDMENQVIDGYWKKVEKPAPGGKAYYLFFRKTRTEIECGLKEDLNRFTKKRITY